MGAKELIILTLVLGITVSQAQYFGRMRGLNSLSKDHCTCTCDDLASLIALARVLEEKEITRSPPPPTNTGLSNVEDLIMKLVNALVYTTTETTKNSCCCSHSAHGTSPAPVVTPNNQGNNDGNGNNQAGHHTMGHQHGHESSGHHHMGHQPTSHQSTGHQSSGHQSSGHESTGHHHMGHQPTSHQSTGHESTGHQSTGHHSTGHHSTGHHSTGHGHGSNSGEGLINLDLLNPNSPSNVAGLDLAKEKLLGVGLGGEGGGGGAGGSGGGASSIGSSNNAHNSGEGLINVDLLNPNKPDNVADVDIAGQTLLGIGLGSHQ